MNSVRAPERLRILLLYDGVFPDQVGGVERRNLEMGRALARLGHRVTLGGFTRDVGLAHEGMEILSLGVGPRLYDPRGRRRVTAALRYARRARSLAVGEFDVVETASLQLLHLRGLERRCRRAGVPLLVTWHEVWGDYWRTYFGPWVGRLGARLERRAARRRGDALIAGSALSERRLTRLSDREVHRVPNGVDLGTSEGRIADAASPPTVVFAGRLIPEKRVDLLLRAVASARVRRPDLRLRVVGEGTQGEALRALAERLGIAERVEWLGRLERDDAVRAVILGALACVQPSAREGFGLIALEALALGVPVIACESSESALPELIAGGVDGFVVEPEAEAIASRILELAADPARRRSMGLAARAKAETYSHSHSAAAFERVALGVLDLD